MLLSYLFTNWTVSPEVNLFGFELPIRWYGVLFASAFLVGYKIMEFFFKREKVDLKFLDKLLFYVMTGTVIGARLGHVLFYDFDYYMQNPAEILMIWHGGLASHGAAIGIIIALLLYVKHTQIKSMRWVLDRVVITVAIGGAFVRTGNLMNHEIVGIPTSHDSAISFVFNNRVEPDNLIDLYDLKERAGGIPIHLDTLYKKYAGPLEKLKNPEVYNKYKNDPYQLAIKERIPRYPAQLFEAICYVFIFIVLMGMYLIPAIRFREGFIFGVFLILLFSARYYVENVKSSQGGFESVIGLDITTGQWLSIPFILAGFYYLVSSKKKHEA